jgi:hypothetical protein
MGTGIQVQLRPKIKPENKLSDEPWWTQCFQRTADAIVALNQEVDQ